MKDRSVKITLLTRELSPEQMAELFFSVNEEIMSVDIDEKKAEGKSKAERLRGVLYRIWENHHKDEFASSALFYDHMMEKIIDYYKDKID